MAPRTASLCALALSCLGTSPAFAAAPVCSVSDDTFINSVAAAAANNMGGTPHFAVGISNGAGALRSLLRFNMPAAMIQGRVTVTAVDLAVVYNVQFVGVQNGIVSFRRMLQGWNEGGSAGARGGGTYLTGGGCSNAATWNLANCNGTGWSGGAGAGGAATGTVSASLDSSSFADGATVHLNTAQLIADVQGFIDGTLSNFGWLITSTSEGSATHPSVQFFQSKQGTTPPSLTVTYGCKAAFAPSGNDCTTCTATAVSDCRGTGTTANACADSGPPSTTYACSCGTAGYKNGNATDGKPGCIIGCTPTNHCRDSGDAAATCAEVNGGYTCGCSTGFISNGTSCIVGCNNSNPTPQPCGNGGTCNTGDGGNTWTCSGCSTGFVSNGASRAACVDFNACDAAAKANCNDSQTGNACVDDAAPALTYHCTCTNPAYVLGTVGGKSACVDKNECVPNQCQSNGDSFAQCTDHAAPATGYDCQCSSNLWHVQTVAGNQTCVDVNECLQPSPGPCLNGACTNITNGGGYSCVCNPGFVELNGNGPTPTCVHPNSCGTASSDLACVTAQMGNTCVDNPPPAIGFNCQCNNPAYVRSVDGRSCIDKNDCDINHCTDGGDTRADCTDLKAPKSGYSCDCSPGFAFDGATCSDIDECSGGPNPCGAHGSCTNAKGGYSCACDSGYALKDGACVAKSSTAISYTVSAGSGCSVGGAGELPAAALLMVALAMLLLRRRRAR